MANKKLQHRWSFLFAAMQLPDYCLSLRSCFNIHKENKTTSAEVPIAAISAMNDIFISSQESQVEHNNNKAKRGKS